MLLRMLFAVLLAMASSWGASYYTVRLDDPKAVYLTPDNFPVHGDGLADDTEAIQQAINKVQETTSQGIVLVPQGRYRLTKTVNIWPGIRVIGYGAARPVFLLAENTPGYQDPAAERYMIFFAGGRPGAGGGAGGPAPPPAVNPPMPAPAPSTPPSATSISKSATAMPARSACVPATPNT